MKSSSTLSIKKIILIAVIATVFAFILVGQQAQGSETNEAEPNALPQITFEYSPFASCSEFVQITKADPFPDGTFYSVVREMTSDTPTLKLYSSSGDLAYEVEVDVNKVAAARYTFSGFYINKEEDSQISEDAIVAVNFITWGINIKVLDTNNAPVPGYKIDLYDSKRQLVSENTTDENGLYYYIDNHIDYSLGDYTIIGSKNGYTDSSVIISGEFVPGKIFATYLTVAPIADTNFSLLSSSTSHGYFDVHTEAYKLNGDELGDLIYDSDGFVLQGYYFYKGFERCEYTVLEDNSIQEKQYTPNNNVVIATYTPHSNDGAEFNNWIATYTSSAAHELAPGDTFTVEAENFYVSLEAEYGDPPKPPVPPTPGGDVENVDASAQTGDSTNALLFAIFAFATAATILTVRRKFN